MSDSIPMQRPAAGCESCGAPKPTFDGHWLCARCRRERDGIQPQAFGEIWPVK